MRPERQDQLFDALTCDPMQLIEQLGDADAADLKWPRRLHELYELHLAFNLRRGMAAEAAAADARDRCILLGDYLGGKMFILPRGDSLRLALRDKQIWSEFDGRNHEVLAARYGLTLQQIYRVLATQGKLNRSKLQGRLFAD